MEGKAKRVINCEKVGKLIIGLAINYLVLMLIYAVAGEHIARVVTALEFGAIIPMRFLYVKDNSLGAIMAIVFWIYLAVGFNTITEVMKEVI